MPVKFQSDAIIQITNLTASRLREILRLTGYWNGTQLYFVWLRLYHYFSGVVWRVLRYSGHLNFTMEIHIVEKCLYWNGPQYTTKKTLIWCILLGMYVNKLHWRHNDHDGVSNHQPHGCLLNRLFRRSSKKTSKLRVTGLCVGISPGPVNSPHKGPVTRKMFLFDDVIMGKVVRSSYVYNGDSYTRKTAYF